MRLADALEWKDSILYWLKRAQKAVATGLGFLTAVAAFGLLPEPYSLWVASAIGVGTTIATYGLPFLVEQVESLPEPEPDNPDAIPASELIAEHAREEAESPAEVADSPTPTPDTPEFDTARMNVNELLAELDED